MSYTPPERTPRKPPSVWKSEQERKEWFARNRPPAPPAPGLPTRDSSRKQYPSEPNRLWQAILWFIDWLNRLAGAEKLKEKTNGEQMLTLGELFEGYEESPKNKDQLAEYIKLIDQIKSDAARERYEDERRHQRADIITDYNKE